MTALIISLLVFCTAVTACHFASIAITIRRFLNVEQLAWHHEDLPPVSVLRPLYGVDNYAKDTLSSTFKLDYPCYEILFCVASAEDSTVPLVKELMRAYPATRARLLIGNDCISDNPKLNNIVKGWGGAAHDWIIIADCNVLMPTDYVQQLFASRKADTGLVASPAIGCRPEGFWAEVECAFLNTYQARWQATADALGLGFAQGKTMLWHRPELEQMGGLTALAQETADDAAATKLVREAGLKVRLTARPFAQPLGYRSAAEVWRRQLRWAHMRRASFFLYFLPEILCGGVMPMIAVAIVSERAGLPAPTIGMMFAILWYGAEIVLAAVGGWRLSILSPLYALTRDLLLPVIFFSALLGDSFVWRGHVMQAKRRPPRPHPVTVNFRRYFAEVARGGQRRRRSLRARTS